MNDRHSMAPVTRNRPQIGNSQRIRLLVADDHALLRQALRVLHESQDGLEVVGEATNGRDAVDSAERLMPDVVLMDMVMPGLNGIEATRQIVKRAPGIKVLILTAYLEDERLLQALRAEALGMQEPGDALVRCILTLSEQAEKITANLLAPLVLCRRTHLARQVVLQDPDLELRAPVFTGAATFEETTDRLAASA